MHKNLGILFYWVRIEKTILISLLVFAPLFTWDVVSYVNATNDTPYFIIGDGSGGGGGGGGFGGTAGGSGNTATEKGDTPGIQGITVTVRINDQNQSPLAGIEVTLSSSNPTTMITNENGVAQFEDVWLGDHKIAFNYQGETVEREIKILNDKENFQINVTVDTDNTMPPWGRGIIITLGISCLGLFLLWSQQRKKHFRINICLQF